MSNIIPLMISFYMESSLCCVVHVVAATMVYKFLIGTFDELMGVMMSPDESSEVLQINSSVGWLLFSDTKMI